MRELRQYFRNRPGNLQLYANFVMRSSVAPLDDAHYATRVSAKGAHVPVAGYARSCVASAQMRIDPFRTKVVPKEEAQQYAQMLSASSQERHSARTLQKGFMR